MLTFGVSVRHFVVSSPHEGLAVLVDIEDLFGARRQRHIVGGVVGDQNDLGRSILMLVAIHGEIREGDRFGGTGVLDPDMRGRG